MTIFPPIYDDMSVAQVRVVPCIFDGGGIGLEDMTLDLSGGSIDNGIFFEEQVGSWLKNVKVKGASNGLPI